MTNPARLRKSMMAIEIMPVVVSKVLRRIIGTRWHPLMHGQKILNRPLANSPY